MTSGFETPRIARSHASVFRPYYSQEMEEAYLERERMMQHQVIF